MILCDILRSLDGTLMSLSGTLTSLHHGGSQIEREQCLGAWQHASTPTAFSWMSQQPHRKLGIVADMANNGVSEFIDESNLANMGAHQPSLSEQEVYDYYSDWARKKTYDVHLGPENYRGPSICAEFINKYVLEKNAEIVDVAAGTGRLGTELKELGYTVVDGLEPAEGMLDVAREKGIYRQYILLPIDPDTPDVATDSYDGLGIAGGMGEGHIKCSALPEMARIVRKGGYVVIVMREAYLHQVAEYKDRLEPKMAQMEKEGLWKAVERTIVPRYSFQNDGVVYVFKIL